MSAPQSRTTNHGALRASYERIPSYSSFIISHSAFIPMSFTAGVARTTITPFWGVELTGWGYYIERRWQRIADDLRAARSWSTMAGKRPRSSRSI